MIENWQFLTQKASKRPFLLLLIMVMKHYSIIPYSNSDIVKGAIKIYFFFL